MTGTAKPRRLHLFPLLALLVLPMAIALQWLGARFPETVEALYSRAVFPPIVATLAWVSSRFAFSLAEVGAACFCVALGWALVRLIRSLLRAKGSRLRILGRAGAVILLVAGIGYLLFLLTWGLNYQRFSFSRSARLPVGPADRDELAALSADLIEEVNSLRNTLPEDGQGAMRLADGIPKSLARMPIGVAALRKRYSWLPVSAIRLKAAWTSPLLARLGIGGFYSPLTAEPHINVELPPSDIPASAAHEVAHQLGFAREDEANYLGYLICRLHPDADFRYSGFFLASRYTQRALASVDRGAARTIESRRSPAVKRDIAVLAAWAARYGGRVMNAFQRANDVHLRIQGQREGTRSYGRMVDLLLAERRAERNQPPPGGENQRRD